MYTPQPNYNPYGAGYQNQFMQSTANTYMNQMPLQQSTDFRKTNAEWIQVNGIQQVRDHIVQPNQQLWFMDNNNPTIYVKTADNFGTTQLKIYRIEEIHENGMIPEKNSENLISRQEFEDLKNRVQAYEQRISELSRPVPDYAREEKIHESNVKNGAK